MAGLDPASFWELTLKEATSWLEEHNKYLKLQKQYERRQMYELASLTRLAIVSAMNSDVAWPEYYDLYPDDKPEGYDEKQAIKNAVLDREMTFAALSMAAEAQARK